MNWKKEFKLHLGKTFFMNLSCAYLRWNELVEIISKLNRLDFSDDVIKNMTYQERCNKNPVLVAGHFQYKVEIFFKVIVLDGPLGKTSYYAIRVEFQVRVDTFNTELKYFLK